MVKRSMQRRRTQSAQRARTRSARRTRSVRRSARRTRYAKRSMKGGGACALGDTDCSTRQWNWAQCKMLGGDDAQCR